MNQPLSPRRFCTRRAFTLIEIMVATVIMVILVGFFIQITSEVLKVWNRSSGKLATNAEARIAMELLTQDLETAVIRNNGQQWLRVDAPKETEQSGSSLYSDQTVALKLFSPALDRPDQTLLGADVSGGDICAIGYRLAYKESYTNGPDVYALYRRVVDPETTFNQFLGSSSQGASSPQLTLTDTTLWADFSGGAAAYGNITDDVNYLAGNIIEFKVVVYEEPVGAAAVTAANVNSSTGELDANYAYGGDTDGDGVADPVGAALLYADIILTVLSDEGLKLVQLIDDQGAVAAGYTGSDSNAIQSIVLQNSEVYTRRVNLMARPL